MKWIFAILAALSLSGPAFAKPPIEAFGESELVRSLEMSPDGKQVAFIQRVQDKDFLVKFDLESGKSETLLRVDELRARYVSWVGNTYIVIVASEMRREQGFRGTFELSGGFAYSLKTRKYVQLLRDTPGIYPAQTGLGRIEGIDPDGEAVYMTAYMGAAGSDPTYDLLKVSLDSGRGSRVGGKKGSSLTRNWVLNGAGEVVARSDISPKTYEYRILAANEGSGFREIYSIRGEDASPVSLVGVSAGTGKLLVSEEAATGETGFYQIREMNLSDGSLGEILFKRPDTDVETLVSDANGVIHGVRYAGMFPTYQMFDAEVDLVIKAVQTKLAGAAVNLMSWSEDWSRLVFRVEGDLTGPRYVMFDRPTQTLRLLVRTRPDVADEFVAAVDVITYKARDKLPIPGLVTWPVGVLADQRKNLPAIIMPHGGPEAYDAVKYDWLAQFLANEGYLVMQPNFRGSDGFGAAHRDAGRGEWGGKMQDDITDGANALVRMGWADPSRMCIMGWSYGGYAALAGGALTPDQYKCVVAIAGVSDLLAMLVKTRTDMGAKSSAFLYWQAHIGDPSRDREKIEAVSPARLAERFKAPVLLVHGTDDTVVPASQSDRMESALKRAEKPVTYLRIKGDDHSLVDNASRRDVLRAVSAFLDQNIGPKAEPAAPAAAALP